MKEWRQMDKPLRDLIEIMLFTEKVSAKIHGVLDEAEIYRTVKEEFAKSKRYNVSILLLTDDGSRLRAETTIISPKKLKAAEKATGLRLKEYKIDVNKSSILSQVVTEGKTIQATVYDVIGELLPRPLVKLISEIMGYEKAKNILTPLKRHGKIIGVFSMSSTELAEHFIPSVRNLAQHISTALEVADESSERKKAEEQIVAGKKKLETYIESMVDGFSVTDANGVLIQVNEALARIHGYKSPKEMVGKPIFRFIAKRELPKAKKMFMESIKKKERFIKNLEVIGLRKDGSEFTAMLNIRNLWNKKGEFVGCISVVRDITERKKAEEKIKNLAKFPSENPNPVLRITKDGTILYANTAGLSLLSEWKREIGQPGPDHWRRLVADILSSGLKEEIEVEHRDRIFSFVLTSVTDADYVNVYGRDITEIKKAQEKVRESEEKYRNLFENARDAIVTFDLKGNVTSINKAVAEHGFKEDKVVGKNMLKFVSKKYWPRLLIELVKVARGSPVEGEIEIITPKGKKIAEYRSNPIRRGDEVVGFQATLRDITERKMLEEKLRLYSEHLEELVRKRTEELLESEKRYSVLVEEASDGVAILQDEKIVFTNKKGPKIISYSRDGLIGLPFEKLVDEKYRQLTKERYMRRLRGEKVPATYEIELIGKTGERVPVELSATRIRYQGSPADLLVVRDIRERKRMEEERLKLERLAAIGEAAAMVGHDLRNPLQAIVNTLYLTKEKLGSMPSPERQGGKELLKTLEEQVEYMNKIVSDLQDYARPVKIEPVETSLPKLINEALSTIKFPETIKVFIEIEGGLDFPKLMVDPALMRRVFTNLVSNALQAMPDGGQLTIRSSKKGETAFVSVQDTGVGIPKEDLDKLFRPLFTTKSKGQGFGLPVCKRLVEAHNGSITVESKVGRGSTFTVKIPLRREVS